MPIAKMSLPYKLNPPDINEFIEGFVRSGKAFIIALDKNSRAVCIRQMNRQALADSDKFEYNISTFFATKTAWDRDLNVTRIEVTLDITKYS